MKQGQESQCSAIRKKDKQLRNTKSFDTVSQYLGIEPNQLIFTEVKVGEIFSKEVLVQNKTQQLIKVKVSQPLGKYFSIEHEEKLDTLSPGLSKKIKVLFSCEKEDDYFDEIKIMCEKKKYVLPLKALKQELKVKYDEIVRKGTICVNSKTKFSLPFKNYGTSCKIKLIKQNWETINFEPDEFSLEKNQQQIVQFSLLPTSWGAFHHRIITEINGIIYHPIDIFYTVADFTYYLTTEDGKKIKQYDLGHMYYGTKKNFTLFAVNETTEAITIKMKVRLGWKVCDQVLQSPQQLGKQCSSVLLELGTNILHIKPFSREPFSMTCFSDITQQQQKKLSCIAKCEEYLNEKILQKYNITDSQFHQTLIIDANDRKLFCSLKGTYCMPILHFRPTCLNYGNIQLKKAVMRKLVIQNSKQNLPLKIAFPKTAFFVVIPSSVIIEPEKSQIFQIYLTPTSLGEFNGSIPLHVSNYKIQFPVSYHCISTEKKVSLSSHLNSFPIQEANIVGLVNETRRKTNMKKYNSILKLSSFKSSQVKSDYDEFQNTRSTNCKTLSKIQLAQNRPIRTNKSLAIKDQKSSQNIIDQGEKLKMPQAKEKLFVTRKIDKYEPYKTFTLKNKMDFRDITNSQIKRVAKNRLQLQQIERQLPPKALKEIQVKQKIIVFGKVFVHSEMVKDFQITNHNDFSIQVEVMAVHPFLSKTNSAPQIIPGHTRYRFEVVLLPTGCGQFQNFITYKINKVHTFQFLVQAEIQLVTLTLSKSNLKLIYQDENNDMFLSDFFTLTNEGNTNAHFSIEQENQMFSIDPKVGNLKSGQSKMILIIYKNNSKEQCIPSGQPKALKEFNKPNALTLDERLTIKVRNGVDMYLRVQSNIFQPKCYIKENRLNFGCCIVPKSKSKSLILRNLSRVICLYEIDNSLDDKYLFFDALKGKVLPESSKEITVTYKNHHIHQLNTSFKVRIRGGLTINVPVQAQSVAPNISILEDKFDFGEVCCGSLGILPIQIKNQSQTMVDLLLDLANRPMTGMEYLDVSFDLDREEKVSLTEKTIGEAVIHKIKVQSKTTLKFFLLYKPKVPGSYEFQLPIYIQNFLSNELIRKMVTCYAKEPKFFLQPCIIKFKKKIINSKDNNCFHPLIEFITIKNPTEKLLKWKIQSPKLQNGKKLCFEIQNKKGQVKPKSWQCINIAFNPYQAGFYCYNLPVLIYNLQKQQYIQQAEIKVEGQGQYPILLFDRRQLILPVVPLNVESVGMFKIINEGYETIEIKHRIQALEDIIPQISLFYPEGAKMGINKKQLYVIVKFLARKPISFTVKLEINDGYRAYELPISGTSDNSLMTIFPYLNDKENSFKLQTVNDTVTLRSIDTRNIIDKLHNYYEQVNQNDYQLPCEVIRRWINTFLKDEKVIRFPEDVVNSNDTLLKFLMKITNKKDLQKNLPEHNSQQQFYETIIRMLKSMGCLLNHIRPYFLLSKQDFYNIFISDPSLKHMVETYRKYYPVMHIQCWIILFYQIISNFWYNPQKIKINDTKSNIYSPNELQVLKWIRIIFVEYNEGDDHRFIDFGKDFKDCLAPIYALFHYTFSHKNQPLQALNKRLVSTMDFSSNTRLLYNMMTKINLIPLISEDEYQNIKEKQMFLLIYQLYESLPQQIPKTSPIIFSCELGEKCIKFIQIKNPSNKIINYWIKMQGSSDFSPEEKDFIRIEPKTTYRLKVQFKSRISDQQIAYLTLFNKQERDNTSGVGCSLVFELRSQIIGRKSIKKLQKLSCPIYDSAAVKIPVENIFNDKEYGNFRITLNEEVEENDEPLKNFNFFVEIEVLKIRRNTVNYVEIFYHPMILKQVKCFLIFCDPQVGEFQYQISGVPQVPKPLQQIKIQNPIYVNIPQALELSLPVYNNHKLKALSVVEQKMQVMKNMNRVNKYFETTNDFFREVEKDEENFKLLLIVDPKILQFIEIPTQIIISQRKGGNGKVEFKNKLKVICNFNIIIRDLLLDFVLINSDKKDVRRFKAHLNVLSQPIMTDLQMRTNARTPLVQQIPIENITNKDWKITLTISSVHGNGFSLKQKETCLSRQILVKRNSKSSCMIVYSPQWISESSCNFNITNITTNQQIIYTIKGIADEPISENHIMLTTFTGKSSLHTITISNPYNQKLVYRIQTDLNEIQCSPEVTLQGSEKANFNIIIDADCPGMIIGYIKFIDRGGRYFWHPITIETEDRIISRNELKLEAMVGEEVEKTLQFRNKFSKSLNFKVNIGCSEISGQKSFEIKQYSSYVYRLKFKPEEPGEKETAIRVFCPEQGAHLYAINLVAFERLRKKLPCLTVQVGRKGYKQIKMECSSVMQPKPISLVSNPNFFVQFDEENLHHSFIIAKIYFQPISEGKQISIIKLQWGNNQEKIYEIEGIGIAPFTVETKEFKSIDKKNVLDIIKFKNPYQVEMANSTFTISLQTNQMKVFKFVGHEDKWQTEIKDILPIPVEFKPQHIGYYEALLTVQADHYKWKYLLKGQCCTELTEKAFDDKIIAKTGEESIKVLKISISDFFCEQGLYPNKIQLHHSNHKLSKIIRSWLNLKLQKQQENNEKLLVNEEFVVCIRFQPTKPIDEIVTLSLFSSLRQNVRVTKKLKIISEPPEPEDKISLEINSIKKHLFNFPIELQENFTNYTSKMQKSQYFEAYLEYNKILLKFSPSNCTFKHNHYSDLLIIESDNEYRSWEIQVKLKNIVHTIKKR